MSDTTREDRLLEAISALTDTLASDYDVVEVAQVLVESSASLFDIDAAGLLIAGPGGELDVLASTSEASRLIEVLQIDAEAGPCLDCFHTGQPVSVPNISTGSAKWSQFIDRARELNFQSVHAIPLRHRDIVIGTLNLLSTRTGELNEPDLRAARALADLTTLGILQDRTTREHITVQQQLEAALSSRVLIEQAKGFVSNRNRVSVDEAFTLLRNHARSHRARLADTAAQVVARELML